MAATTEDRNTPRRATNTVNAPVAAATKIPAGVMVALDANGRAVNAADAANLVVIGRAAAHADNSAGSAGDISVNIERGIYLWENDGTNAVAASHVGRLCYVKDNQTVASTGGTNSIVAGVVHEVSSAGVWVDTSLGALRGATGATGPTGPTGV